jgi:hypothetical protein
MKPTEQYFRFPRSLLTSHAFRALNIHELRTLFCIMEEHQAKSGFIKDGLIVTRRDFTRWGVDTHHVTASLAVLRNLWIVQQTRNMGGSRDGRTPNMYKPTFLPSDPGLKDATHDYLRIETREEAERIAEQHRFKRLRKPPVMRKRRLRVVSSPTIASQSTVALDKKDTS